MSTAWSVNSSRPRELASSSPSSQAGSQEDSQPRGQATRFRPELGAVAAMATVGGGRTVGGAALLGGLLSAGLSGAVSAGFSGAQNYVASRRGEKTRREAMIDTAKTTAVGAAQGAVLGSAFGASAQYLRGPFGEGVIPLIALFCGIWAVAGLVDAAVSGPLSRRTPARPSSL